jgi:isoleucyl-tRNA synthetase
MMDEIRIYMAADDEIKAAVKGSEDFIKDETIAVAIEEKEDLPVFDINGHKTGLAVERI